MERSEMRVTPTNLPGLRFAPSGLRSLGGGDACDGGLQVTSESEGDYRLNEAAVRRRINFVIEEARQGMRTKDQAIGVALRVASNYSLYGRHTTANRMKMECKHVSREALADRGGYKRAWHKKTTNEHWLPIKKVWEYII